MKRLWLKLLPFSSLAPACQKLLEALKLEDINFQGWAVYNTETGELAENGYGYCIYATRQEAEELLALWSKSEKRGNWLAKDAETVSSDEKQVESEEETETTIQLRKMQIRPIKITPQGLEYLNGDKNEIGS